jgi:hypothetical protein
LFGLRLRASVCLALYVAFWLELGNAYWAGTLGATGGTDGQAFTFAIRLSEISIGIVCAGVVLVLAGTDFGVAPRRLAGLLAVLSAKIAVRFGATLTSVDPSSDTQPIRRELIRQVIALDPMIDEAIGESSQEAVDGLFAALAGWRTVAARLARLQAATARRETRLVLAQIPRELRRLARRAAFLSC